MSAETPLAFLDVIDGIVDDTHPEGDGCPLCVALDDLRAVLSQPVPDLRVALAQLPRRSMRWNAYDEDRQDVIQRDWALALVKGERKP